MKDLQMDTLKTYLLFPALLLGFTACRNDTPPAAMPLPTMSSGQPAKTMPDAYLEGLYATSSAPGSDVYALFDGEPANEWRTQPGAGPDEGIMLYFSNQQPLQIGSLEVTPVEGIFADTAEIQLYVNGRLDQKGLPGHRIRLSPLSAEESLSSIFIRFVKTGREAQKQRDEIDVHTFPPSAAVALKALTLYDRQMQPLHLAPPKRLHGQLMASSSLAPETAYGPANLFDARKEFAWVEGSATAAGEGETLHFRFDQSVQITAIQVWNGYQRSDDHFTANARVRDFEFGADQGPAGQYTLRATKAGQKIPLAAAVTGQHFTLKIKSIYPGRTYKDLAISEIVFYDGQQPFVLVSDASTQNQQALRTKVAKSPLANVLDRRISNVLHENETVTRQSFILRSDGTFVLYSMDVEPDDTESETLADGNWELLQTDASTATVKIFGKWNNLSESLDYYQGSSSQQVTRIFSDVLTIDHKTLQGRKMVSTFYLP